MFPVQQYWCLSFVTVLVCLPHGCVGVWNAEIEKAYNNVLKTAYTLYQETFIIPIADGQFEKMFNFFEELGQGSFATVYR